MRSHSSEPWTLGEDTGSETREAGPPHGFRTSRRAVAPAGGRPVDTEVESPCLDREQNRPD